MLDAIISIKWIKLDKVNREKKCSVLLDIDFELKFRFMFFLSIKCFSFLQSLHDLYIHLKCPYFHWRKLNNIQIIVNICRTSRVSRRCIIYKNDNICKKWLKGLYNSVKKRKLLSALLLEGVGPLKKHHFRPSYDVHMAFWTFVTSVYVWHACFTLLVLMIWMSDIIVFYFSIVRYTAYFRPIEPPTEGLP